MLRMLELKLEVLNRISSQIRDKRILITGASGFVGRSLLRLLAQMNKKDALNIHVAAQYRTMSNCEETRVINQHLVADVNHPLEIEHPPDIIFHCATPASAELNIERPRDMLELNIRAMDWILGNPLLIKSCPVVVFTSSGAVYGEQPESLTHIHEGWNGAPNPLAPGIAYAEGKRIAEFLLSEAGREGNVRPIIARLFAFSGIGLPLDRHFAIGNFVKDAMRNNQIVIRGDGKTVRSYLDSEDMAIWLLSAALNTPKMPLHIGSSQAISILDLAITIQEAFKKLSGVDCGISIEGVSTKFDGVKRYVPGNELTRHHLSVDEWTDLRSSIKNMFIAAQKPH